MENFEKQGGVSFFLLSFTKRDEFYYLRLDVLFRVLEARKGEAAERVSAMRNWTRSISCRGSAAFWFRIWMHCRRICCAGIDNYSKISYNKQSFTCYHATIVAR